MKMRALHPEFFTDPVIAALSFQARVLFAGLWCHVDDYGRGRWLPKAIEGDVFPRDDVDIERLLDELVQARLLIRYQVGDDFFQIRSWEKYQKPKYRAKTSIPPPQPALEESAPDSAQSQENFSRQEEVLEEVKASSSDGFAAFLADRAAEAVKERRRKGLLVKSDSGLARVKMTDPKFVAESKRIWAHRDCSNCRGKGVTEEYAPGAGTREVECAGVSPA